MASLQEIKTRLNSIATTKKITKAMQLVATAKLQKAQASLKGIQEYYTSVYETFQDLLANVNDIEAIMPSNPKDSTLYIVISSDLGLCGSYNSNVYKLLHEEMKANDKLTVIGTKGVSHFKAVGKTMHLELPSAGDEPNYTFASEVGKDAISLFLTGEIKAIKLVHTKFINSVTQEANITSILPADKVDTKGTKKELGVTEFEPSAEKVLVDAIPLYVSAMIFGSMVDSKVSEMSSRRTAMENATDNAEDIIEHLDLEYNRARQAAITQEISEIVAGADSE